MFVIISEGVSTGFFSEEVDARNALLKYFKSGFIQSRKGSGGVASEI